MEETTKKRVAIFVKAGGQNGGPFVSHMRITQSGLSKFYDFSVIEIPRHRELVKPSGMRTFVNKIKSEHCDFGQIVGLELDGYFTSLACKKAGLKFVLAVHGSSCELEHQSLLDKIITNFTERKTIERSSIIYGVSDYVCSWPKLRNSGKLYGAIYNLSHVPAESEIAIKSTIRQELGIGCNDIVVASTGRIVKEKGFDICTKVIRDFASKSNVKFVIAGEGNYLCEMKKELKAQIEAKQVFLLGYRNDVDNILSGSDIFLICTKHETLCISLLEAGWNGLPMVATDVGGVPEIVDEDCGFLVKKNDVAGFEEKLNDLIGSQTLRKKMGATAKAHILDKFDNTKIEAKLREIYDQIGKA